METVEPGGRITPCGLALVVLVVSAEGLGRNRVWAWPWWWRDSGDENDLPQIGHGNSFTEGIEEGSALTIDTA